MGTTTTTMMMMTMPMIVIEQVNQIHAKHKNRMEIVRGNNKAKATDSILSRMEQAGKKVQGLS